ncbi:MAG TPA: hypothetical protein EYQ78_01360 [Candidatus Poseidoniales archaeon]|nr:hypothetical protein [Candidatus Poseidoniales archaeon]
MNSRLSSSIIIAVFLSSLLVASMSTGNLQNTTSVSSQDNGSQDFTLDSLPDNQMSSARSSNNSTSHLAWEWASSAGSNTDDSGLDIATGPSGDVYILGQYKDTISFGTLCPTLGTFGSTISSIYVGKFDSTGACIWIVEVNSTLDAGIFGGAISVDSNENVYITSDFENNVEMGNTSLNSSYRLAFVAKLDLNGTWLWATPLSYSGAVSNGGRGHGIDTDTNGNVFFVGRSKGTGFDHGFIAKLNSSGVIQWQNELGGNQGSSLSDAAVDSNGNLYVAGWFKGPLSVQIGGTNEYFTSSHGTSGAGHRNSMLVGKLDSSGDWLWFRTTENGTETAESNSIAINSNDEIYVVGSFYTSPEFGPFTLSTGNTENGFVVKLNSSGDWKWAKHIDCAGTTIPYDVSTDTTGNAYITGKYNGNTVNIGSVYLSPVGGGYDIFVFMVDASGTSQWAQGAGGTDKDIGNAISIDHLGMVYTTGSFGATADFSQLSLITQGASDMFYARLSSDYDGDGDADTNDDDDDDDYILDVYDLCQFSEIGFRSVAAFDHDSDGCRDADEDEDDDNDGLNDNLDNCARGMTGWTSTNATDYDSDGCNDALEDQDDDSDGIEDYLDLCPRNSGNSTFEFEMGCRDDDGDGRPNIRDPFPHDPTEWSDLDGDGIGNNGDAFPFDSSQQSDGDEDGYGDNLAGRLPDLFPDNPTQWEDIDGDGLGDNQSGTAADPSLNDYDNDGYNDSIDILPKLASPGDHDNDGCLDEEDTFPLNYKECSDFDGDGEGDNADTDDDGDGWSDTDELRLNSNPLDSADYPVEGFEIIIPFPGGAIGLGAWDLMGIVVGIPLFTWIAFGFVTRNRRCLGFEVMLDEARTKQELEDIALKAEYALMLRLLGPHQGIRLERLRAELDDALDGEGMQFDENQTDMVDQELDQMDIRDEMPEIELADNPKGPPASIVAEGMTSGKNTSEAEPPSPNAVGIVGQDGYEWLQQGGATWHRAANSGSDWEQWLDD